MKITKTAKSIALVMSRLITALSLIAAMVYVFKWGNYSVATFYLVLALYFKVSRIETDYLVQIEDKYSDK